MLSGLFKFGPPNHCLWQGDLGKELKQSIVSFTKDNPKSNAGRPFLDSNIGPFHLSSVYNPYPIVPTDNTTGVLYVRILHTINHFRALVPPRDYEISEIRRFFYR